MDIKHLLVISAYAPPNPAVGGKRFAFLNQEFVKKGYEVTVLTLPNRKAPGADSSLPQAGRTMHIPNIAPLVAHPNRIWEKIYNRLLVSFATPDPWVGWLIPVVSWGIRQIRTQTIDMVIATGPPFTSLLAGAILARTTGVPLILDYRDPWTGFLWPKKKFSNTAWHRALETWVVRQADGLVFVTQTMSEAFASQFPAWLGKPFRIITNGYPPSRLEQEEKSTGTRDGKKTIIYTGNFYGERNIWLLLEALLLLIEQKKVQPHEVELVVFGSIPAHDLEKIHAHDIGSIVRQHDPVPHGQIAEELRHGDILYLVSGRDVSYALPYKIFDYLAAERPILAIAPSPSEVERFMIEHRCGLFVPMNDPERIADSLNQLLTNNWETGNFIHNQFHWDHLAATYIEFIQTLGRDNCGRA